MRTYTETHSHITFRLDLKKASYKLWMLLGEACSKAEYLVGMPLLPAVEDSLFQLYLEKGVLATTAIEGNSLTEAQVRQLREGTLKLPPSKEYLGQEIENIITVCNAVSDHILSGKRIEILFDDIMRYNALILKDLPLEEGVVPGKIRTYDVTFDLERREQARLRPQVGKVDECLLHPAISGLDLLDNFAGIGFEQLALRRDRRAIAALAAERRFALHQHQHGPARRHHGEIERRSAHADRGRWGLDRKAAIADFAADEAEHADQRTDGKSVFGRVAAEHERVDLQRRIRADPIDVSAVCPRERH